ncbi:MAG: CotH kinase family protein [Bacteroidetes bacterium]|nr:CotH kinase family protein [Bacteroidota bacterium]
MKNRFYIIICLLISGIQTTVAQNPGDSTFNSSVIHNINFTFSQPNFFDSLMYYKQHADSFNLSTQNMMAGVTIDGTPIDSIGVKFKGNSTFGCCGRKRPIRLTFNEYATGKKFDGLTIFELNNMVLDPSYMREKLMLDFMNKKGLPAPRCTYAKVSFNGQYVGLYKMIEQVDKQFISTHYHNWGGNLFKGDPMGTLGWMGSNPASYYPDYELHSNTTANNWSDFVNLIDNINNTPAANFYDTLETNLNTTPIIKQWAARNLFVDLDSYFHSPHNYYLYHNTVTNKFEWNTWDVSVSFGFYFWPEDSVEKVSILMSNGPPLTTRMLANNTYKTTYLNTICDYLDYLDTTVMSPIIDSIANVIRPSIYAEPDSNQMFQENIFEGGIDTSTYHLPLPPPMNNADIPGLKKFIINRRANVISQLALLPFICTNGVNDLSGININIAIYPNPFSTQTTLQTNNPFHNATLTVDNCFGQTVKQIKNINGRTVVFSRDNLASGLYFVRLTEENKTIAVDKLVITKTFTHLNNSYRLDRSHIRTTSGLDI